MLFPLLGLNLLSFIYCWCPSITIFTVFYLNNPFRMLQVCCFSLRNVQHATYIFLTNISMFSFKSSTVRYLLLHGGVLSPCTAVYRLEVSRFDITTVILNHDRHDIQTWHKNHKNHARNKPRGNPLWRLPLVLKTAISQPRVWHFLEP